MASVNRNLLQTSESTLTAATNNGSGVSLEPHSLAFVGWIKVPTINAATTVNAKIQHSPDNTNWTDVVSFTAIAGVVGYEVKQITVNLLSYVRSVVTLSGVTLSAQVEVVLYNDKYK